MLSKPSDEWQTLPELIYWDAQQVADCLRDMAEHVLIDVREEGVFATAHLFYATCISLSRLELRLPFTVPRRDTCIVLLADDFQTVRRAFEVMRQAGYSNLHALRGGNSAWREAGYRLFSGIYVPSKAFGEFVEHEAMTPRIQVANAREHLRDDATHCFVDCRPESEFQDFSFEGAVNCPGAELLLRLPAIAQSRTLVINCAGRTRSIIGAQSLINAGLSNPVYAFENGTMAWHLDGGALQPGAAALLPRPDAEAIEWASQRACALAQALQIPWIEPETLSRMQKEKNRTTYCFDVRLPGDHARGHWPGCLSAPGGQLVQSTDFYAPVRRARLVLWDTDHVQAPLTAHWLVQMGWEVYLLKTPRDLPSEKEARPQWPVAPLNTRALSAADYLVSAQQQTVMLIDCDDSRHYRRRHLKEAHWLTRSRIPELRHSVEMGTCLVFTASDPQWAAWAASDAHQLGLDSAYLNAPGHEAASLIGTDNVLRWLGPTDDAWYSPYQLDSGVAQAMKAYIEWETDLLSQLHQEPGVNFQIYKRPAQ